MARRFGETALFRTASAVIAVHVLDDSFLQPEPGVSPADHLLSGLAPVGVLAAVAIGYPRLRAGLRAVCALLVGGFGLTVASEAAYYTGQGELGGDDVTGWLCVPAGLVLMGLAAVVLWRSRRQTPNRVLRYSRRLGWAVLAVVVANLVGYPVATAYVVTHALTATVPDPDPGMDYEDVSFTTSDGLRLVGWYLPSRNGAAVIVFPGREGRQDHARMLAGHGYGALLFDRRGEGDSEGDPNLLGWGGDRDVEAAVEFLQSRPDVDPGRIGGLGLSVGGELMLEAAAETDGLQAVVSEGAGARSYRETSHRTNGNPVEMGVYHLLTAATRVFSDEPVPPDLDDLVAEIAPRSVLFVYGEEGQPQEIDLNPTFYESAGEPRDIWEVPGAGHIDGLHSRPAAYERRVVGFFDEALLGR
jgi:dienelactone hydrolase